MAAHRPQVRFALSIARTAAILASLVGLSCDKMPLVAPTGTAITLVSATNVLPVNGSAEITAFLIQGVQSGSGTTSGVTAGGGTPVHNGTVVTFSTTMGRIEPAEAQTNAGKAVVRLIGDGQSGTATIRAFSGGAASEPLEVKVGSAGAARVVATANPQSLPANGGTTSVTARVDDAQGNGLSGVPVSFSTDKGTLSQTLVLTSNQGFAVTQLTTTQAATVTASSGSVPQGTVAISLRAQTTLTITPPATMIVSAPAAFTVTAGSTVSGAPPIVTNMQVDFGDGTPKTPPVTLASTAAQTIQHLFARKGSLTVVATGVDAEGSPVSNSVQVAVGGFTAAGSAQPSPATVGATVTFNISVAPATVIIDHYEFDFGDGNSTVTSAGQTTHAFGSAGFRTVSVRVVPISGDAVVVLIPLVINP
jgi:hypothetical protein